MPRPQFRQSSAEVHQLRELLKLLQQYRQHMLIDSYQTALARELYRVLSEREFRVLYRYYVQKRTQEQVAEDLDLCVSTVSRSVQRGVEKIRTITALAQEISPLRLF